MTELQHKIEKIMKLEGQNKELLRKHRNQEKVILEQAKKLEKARDMLREARRHNDEALSQIEHDLGV